MRSVSKFITRRLRLRVNEKKSSVGRPWSAKYLGLSMTNSRTKPKIRLHWKTLQRFKERIRELTRRTIGRSLSRVIEELNQFLRGWWGYFSIIESHSKLAGIENWIRRRLRSLLCKQWKNRRTRVRELHKRGISKQQALTTGCARKGAWRMSQVKWVMIALPNQHFDSLGLVIPWI